MAPAAPLHAVYPGGRHVPLRVRAFVEFLREQLRDMDWRLRNARDDLDRAEWRLRQGY